MENDRLSKIKSYFEGNNIYLSDIQCKQFEDYFLTLIEWNEKINLTAITQFDDVIVKHFYDSCVCYKLLSDNAKVIDIGCGAGFPSIPLKILRPDLELTLVDSVNKKIMFINNLVDKLNLSKVTTIHSRAEDLAKNIMHREKYDYCVSRAVARINTLCEYCLPFVKVGGTMLAYKSKETEEEVKESQNAIKLLGGSVSKIIDFTVLDYCRKVVEIKKTSLTNAKFPRGNNKPRTSPLK